MKSYFPLPSKVFSGPIELKKVVISAVQYFLQRKTWNNIQKYSFEPESNQRPKDVCFFIQLQSSALPTELSKEGWNLKRIWNYKAQTTKDEK